MSRSLLLQLARLGDLIQSLPAISSLHSSIPNQPLDLLCAAPLTPIGKLFSGIQRVYPWEGERWHTFACKDRVENEHLIKEAEQYLRDCAFPPYTLAYNLNNHPRSILASHLLSAQVVGAGEEGPLHPSCPPWVDYLRHVARERGRNRIHLADAFCGVCGVRPPEVVPTIQARDVELPSNLSQIMNDASLMKIGIVLGAGDAERRVPIATWRRLIEVCAEDLPNCLCVLIGGRGERDAALALEDQLSFHYLSRVFNGVGTTTLPQLAHVFNRCEWVIGSDTGPLHLGVACGAKAIGWYFSRARVHETGPYGEGHWVWQAEGHQRTKGTSQNDHLGVCPEQWPVTESVELLLEGHCQSIPAGWSVWNSHRDHWGAFYSEMSHPVLPPVEREQIWQRLASGNDIDWNFITDVLGSSDRFQGEQFRQETVF